jgi:hypothetical protein
MPKTPIVLFTISDGVMSKALASAVKVDLVLAKPNGLHDMVTHVEELLSSEYAGIEANPTCAMPLRRSAGCPNIL